MATRTITYKTCDGCHRNDLITADGIEIVWTKTVTVFCGPTKTVDLCSDCVDAERYYCRLCDRIHTDDTRCDAQLREIERMEVNQ